MRLAGKVAIVTGGARGIGKAIASRFAAEGASVFIADVNSADGAATAGEIAQAGGDCHFVATDVSDDSAIEALFRAVVDMCGGPDVLVNNAVCAAAHITADEWQPTIDVVLKGTHRCSVAATAMMGARRGGSIVNISSVNALMGLQGIHVYSAAKGGVIALTRSLAIQHAAEGIRVNAICPGTIRTEVWDPILREKPDLMAEYARLYPLGRVGTPEDVANCALFLASDSTRIGAPGDALRFYSVNIYDEAFNNLRMGRACCYAVILFLLIFAVTLVQLRLSKRFVHTEGA